MRSGCMVLGVPWPVGVGLECGPRVGRELRQGSLLVAHPGHRGKAWSDDTSQLGPDKHARDVPSLDKYAEERWEVRSWTVSWLVLPVPSALRGSSVSVLFLCSGGPALHGGLPQCSRQSGLGSAPQPGWTHEEVRKPEV